MIKVISFAKLNKYKGWNKILNHEMIQKKVVKGNLITFESYYLSYAWT